MIIRKMRVPGVGATVRFNGHYLDVRDVLYELIDRPFVVKMIDENNLLTLHSLPEDGDNPAVAMGIEPRLLLDRHGVPLA